MRAGLDARGEGGDQLGVVGSGQELLEVAGAGVADELALVGARV